MGAEGREAVRFATEANALRDARATVARTRGGTYAGLYRRWLEVTSVG